MYLVIQFSQTVLFLSILYKYYTGFPVNIFFLKRYKLDTCLILCKSYISYLASQSGYIWDMYGVQMRISHLYSLFIYSIYIFFSASHIPGIFLGPVAAAQENKWRNF